MQALTKKEKARAERREAFYAGKRELTLSEKLNGVKPNKNMFVDLSKLKKPILKKKCVEEVKEVKKVKNLKRLTRNEINLKAVIAYEKGLSSKEVGKMFGISHTTVRYLSNKVRKSELIEKIKKDKIENKIMIDAVNLRNQNKTYRFIAGELSLSENKVSTLLKRARKNGLI